MSVTVTTLAATYGAELKATRKAINVSVEKGLDAVISTSVLAYAAWKMQGASFDVVKTFILGTQKDGPNKGKPVTLKSDGARAKIFRTGKALAASWGTELFPGMVALVQTPWSIEVFNDLVATVREHLTNEACTSVDKLDAWLSTGTASTPKPLPVRVANSIKAAVKKKEVSNVDAAQMAEGILNTLGYGLSQAFMAKAQETFAAMQVAAADAVAKTLITMPEPSDDELLDTGRLAA